MQATTVYDLRYPSAEEAIIGMILHRPELIAELKKIKDFGPADFFTEFNRRVYEYIISKTEESEGVFDEGWLSEAFNEGEMGRIVKMKIRRMELSNNSAETLRECVMRLKEASSVKNVVDIQDLEELIKNKRRKNQ